MFITQFTSEFTKNGLQLFPWSTSNECRPHRSDASSHERYTPLRPVVTVASSLCKCQKKRMDLVASSMISCSMSSTWQQSYIWGSGRASYSLGQVSPIDQEFIPCFSPNHTKHPHNSCFWRSYSCRHNFFGVSPLRGAEHCPLFDDRFDERRTESDSQSIFAVPKRCYEF